MSFIMDEVINKINKENIMFNAADFNTEKNGKNIEDHKFGVPVGGYEVVLKDAVEALSKKTGNPFYLLTFSVTEGDYQDYKVTYFLSGEMSAKKHVGELQDCGFEEESLAKYRSYDEFRSKFISCMYKLIGKKFSIYVGKFKPEEKDEEVEWMKITSFKDIPNAAVQKVVTPSASMDASSAKEEIPF